MKAGDIALWLGVVVGMPLAVGLIVRWLKRKIGCACAECGERMASYDALPREEQHVIIRHFREHEHRVADTRLLLACRRCGLLYDEFMVDRLSRDMRPRPICKACGRARIGYMSYAVLRGQLSAFRRKTPGLADTCECLRCRRLPTGEVDCTMCDTPRRVLGCYNCLTLYEWRPVQDSRFRVLAPVTGRSVIAGSPTGHGG